MADLIETAAADLRSALSAVKHSASKEGTSRPILSVVMFEVIDAGLRLAAADNFRITVRTVDCDATWRGRRLLPIGDVPTVLAWLKGEKGMVVIEVEDRTLTFRTQISSMSITCMDGTYPNFDEVVTPARTGGVHLALQARYLAEAGKAFGDGMVYLRYRGPLLPLLIEDPATGQTETIMPIRDAVTEAVAS